MRITRFRTASVKAWAWTDKGDLQLQPLPKGRHQYMFHQDTHSPLLSPNKPKKTRRLPSHPRPSTSARSSHSPPCQSTRPSGSLTPEAKEHCGRVRVQVYCRSLQVGEGDGAWDVEAGLHALQVSTLTKLSLRLVLFRKLAAHNPHYHNHFRQALRDYEAFLLAQQSLGEIQVNESSSRFFQNCAKTSLGEGP